MKFKAANPSNDATASERYGRPRLEQSDQVGGGQNRQQRNADAGSYVGKFAPGGAPRISCFDETEKIRG